MTPPADSSLGQPFGQPPDRPHVLVVDDDARLRGLLSRYLGENGFWVTQAGDAAEARARLQSLRFDAIVLDLMMPGESGLSFAEDFKSRDDTPVLILTAMSEPEDRIGGLETGADDYLVKPFEPRELLLRLQNAVRRARAADAAGGTGTGAAAVVQLGVYTFDARKKLLTGESGETVNLTESELSLLAALCGRPNAAVSREDLAEQAGMSGGARAVDVQITRLRRKLEPNPKSPRYVRTVRGRGYLLAPD
ncbi:MAG: response regulator transcription factor [Rhodospirillales bacterium]